MAVPRLTPGSGESLLAESGEPYEVLGNQTQAGCTCPTAGCTVSGPCHFLPEVSLCSDPAKHTSPPSQLSCCMRPESASGGWDRVTYACACTSVCLCVCTQTLGKQRERNCFSGSDPVSVPTAQEILTEVPSCPKEMASLAEGPGDGTHHWRLSAM